MCRRPSLAILSAIFVTTILLLHRSTNGQLIISSAGSTTTIDFESTLTGSNQGLFSGGGLDAGATAVGRLDSNSWKVLGLSESSMAFGDMRVSGDFARGTSAGGVTTGGVYAFDASAFGGTIGLGVQPGGNDFTPGSITLKLNNNTGQAISNFALGYQVRIWNDQNRANSFNFSYSFDDSNYIPVNFFDVTSEEVAVGSPSWELAFDGGTTGGGITLSHGSDLFFRWSGDDVSGGGSRDQFQLDNIKVSFHAAAVPEPGSIGLLVGLLIVAPWIMRLKKRRAGQCSVGRLGVNSSVEVV